MFGGGPSAPPLMSRVSVVILIPWVGEAPLASNATGGDRWPGATNGTTTTRSTPHRQQTKSVIPREDLLSSLCVKILGFPPGLAGLGIDRLGQRAKQVFFWLTQQPHDGHDSIWLGRSRVDRSRFRSYDPVPVRSMAVQPALTDKDNRSKASPVSRNASVAFVWGTKASRSSGRSLDADCVRFLPRIGMPPYFSCSQRAAWASRSVNLQIKSSRVARR
jgi:hypothetical protein